MIPIDIQSNFASYKKNTNAVAIWLAATARRFGYVKQCSAPSPLGHNTEPLPSKRLKGKARKLAKESQDASKPADTHGTPPPSGPVYAISTEDYVSFAEHIANHRPAIQVPADFSKALNMAIRERQISHKWYANQSGEDPVENEKHNHFITVLEHTQDLLLPQMTKAMKQNGKRVGSVVNISAKTTDAQQGLKAAQLDEASGGDAADRHRNIFHGLELYEPSEDFLNAPEVVADPGSRRSKCIYKVQQPQEDVVELSLALYHLFTDVVELSLALYHLFTDVARVKKRVQQMWWDYRQGHLDLASVSITTNTAIEFVNDLDKTYGEQFPSYRKCPQMQQMMFGAQCRHRGIKPFDGPEDYLFFLKDYELADRLCMPAYAILSTLAHVLQPGWVPSLKGRGANGRDTQTLWFEMSPPAKFQHDKLLLQEMFDGFIILSKPDAGLPAEDELVRGIRSLLKNEEPSFGLSFAAQTFLDIHHVMGDQVGNGFIDMRQGLTSLIPALEMTLDFLQKSRRHDWPKHNDLVFEQNITAIDYWVVQDSIRDNIMLVHDKLVKFGLGSPRKGSQINTVPEDHQLLRQYPLLCGLWLFRFKIDLQKAALNFVNAYGNVRYTGQLYYAARRSGHIQEPWLDMETIFTLHGAEDFFVGRFPVSAKEDVKQYGMGVGYSAANFTPHFRGKHLKGSSKGPRGLNTLSPLSHLFEERYVNNAATTVWKRETMELLLVNQTDEDDADGFEIDALPSATKRPVASTKIRSNVKGARAAKDGISLAHFLSKLLTGLHSEYLDMSFDYLRLHHQCWRLLQAVNKGCTSSLSEVYGSEYLCKGEVGLPDIVGLIFVTTTSFGDFICVRPRLRGHQEPTDRVLALAAKPFRKMITRGEGSTVLEILRKDHGLNVDTTSMQWSRVDLPTAPSWLYKR